MNKNLYKEMSDALESDRDDDDEDDMVNSPAHYNFAGVECIDAIRAATGEEGFS